MSSPSYASKAKADSSQNCNNNQSRFKRLSRKTSILLRVKRDVSEKDIVEDLLEFSNNNGITDFVKGPSGIYEVSFIDQLLMDAFIESYETDDKYIFIRRCEPKFVKITFLWVSKAISDEELRFELSKYAKIVSAITCEPHKLLRNCNSGKRYVYVDSESISPDLPSSISFGTSSVMLICEGAIKSCFKCGTQGHIKKNCPRNQELRKSETTNNAIFTSAHDINKKSNVSGKGAGMLTRTTSLGNLVDYQSKIGKDGTALFNDFRKLKSNSPTTVSNMSTSTSETNQASDFTHSQVHQSNYYQSSTSSQINQSSLATSSKRVNHAYTTSSSQPVVINETQQNIEPSINNQATSPPHAISYLPSTSEAVIHPTKHTSSLHTRLQAHIPVSKPTQDLGPLTSTNAQVSSLRQTKSTAFRSDKSSAKAKMSAASSTRKKNSALSKPNRNGATKNIRQQSPSTSRRRQRTSSTKSRSHSLDNNSNLEDTFVTTISSPIKRPQSISDISPSGQTKKKASWADLSAMPMDYNQVT